MTNTILLRNKINESGLKMRFIAARLGISHQTLLNKIRNDSEFTATEIMLLVQMLGLTNKERDSIFFACVVDCNSTH